MTCLFFYHFVSSLASDISTPLHNWSIFILKLVYTVFRYLFAYYFSQQQLWGRSSWSGYRAWQVLVCETEILFGGRSHLLVLSIPPLLLFRIPPEALKLCLCSENALTLWRNRDLQVKKEGSSTELLDSQLRKPSPILNLLLGMKRHLRVKSNAPELLEMNASFQIFFFSFLIWNMRRFCSVLI